MNLTFDHSFGLVEKGEVYHYRAELTDVQPHEHEEAINLGWLATAHQGQPRWYQSRSTRCDLSAITYDIMPDAEILDPVPRTELDHIYSAYCLHRGFRKYFEVNDDLANDVYMGYRDWRGDLVAWSKLRPYSPWSIETVLFAWDYREPDLKLGLRTLEHELAWARRHGYRWVYMGPGYERVNRYKSRVAGFEWWTGSAWSNDVEHYQWLCDRDSRIKSVLDLHDLGTDR
jgi:hypothetical protein